MLAVPHSGRDTARLGGAAVVALSWLFIAALSAFTLWHAGAPSHEVVRYGVAWVVGSTVPGVLTWRALAGHSTFVREVGYGSVLGIVLQLAAWALGTSIHHARAAMILLSLGVPVAFLAVPALRRHWWPRRTSAARTPARWHLAMAAVIALSLYRFDRLVPGGLALPPKPTLVPRDSWYNSAIAYELSRTLRPQDPFAAGQPLRYHWFADAHVTATAQLSGTPIAHAMIMLWLVPILVVVLLVTAATAEQFLGGTTSVPADGTGARRWWVGPVAALFAYAVTPVWGFGRPGGARAGDGYVPSSPSGILALLLVLAISGPVLNLLRGRAHRRGTWVVLALLLAAGAGTKPSVLPVVACGAAVVLVVDLVRERRVNLAMASVLAASVLLTIVAAPFLIGSTGGSHPQLLAIATLDPSYVRLMGDEQLLPAAGGAVVPALGEGKPGAVPVLAMILGVSLLTELPRLLALAGWVTRPLRTDPGVRWAGGVLAGGYLAMWLLAHPGYGEHYFWTVTVALATAVTVANAVRVLPAALRARDLVVPVALVAVPGVLVGVLINRLPVIAARGSSEAFTAGRLVRYVLVLAVLAGAVLLARLAARLLRSEGALPVITAVTAFGLAACVPASAARVHGARAPRLNPVPTVGTSYRYVSPEQSRAALWLQRHTPSTAVVATNVVCYPMGQHTPDCIKNSMWLSGLSGRRLVLGDWTYSTATMAAYDATAYLNRLPAPWPDRLMVSSEAVQRPTADVLARLTKTYRARWIFADTRASTISPDLDRLATLRYRSSHIRIYELVPPARSRT